MQGIMHGRKKEIQKDAVQQPANHQFRSPEIAKNVVITNAEMDPIKSNIDGQAMTGTFDKPIIVASAFFDILNLLFPQERDESRTFYLLHLLQLLQKLRRANFRLPDFYIVTNLNCRSKSDFPNARRPKFTNFAEVWMIERQQWTKKPFGVGSQLPRTRQVSRD